MGSHQKNNLSLLDDQRLRAALFITAQRLNIMEILDDYYDQRSTSVPGHIPADNDHKLIGDQPQAYAILDRLAYQGTESIFRANRYANERGN